MGISMPDATLNSGHRIPLIGFGTASFPFPLEGSETATRAILEAIKIGYRHFDTAALYQTEVGLGEAIEEALHLGLIESRDELFITSKLWCTHGRPERVLPAIRESLKNLKLDYLDLYLIHMPMSFKSEKPWFPLPGEFEAMDFKSVWEQMEACQRLGLARSIGVSNFSCKKLQHILTTANIPPAVNQVEMNALWQQNKLREFCKSEGIVITAYSPLGGKGTSWGSNRVMECEVIKEIATEKGKTHAQVCLRWLYEQGVSMVVKSFNKERMKENLEIFDWELTSKECEQIKKLPQSRGFTAQGLVSEDGPFKSIEDIWDGEI